ncbi:hypothetical protein K438DRAFT_2149570 [Mycena galopus ATCC 62051]|nr:hypothetical protein K438DRAFT_2149570 [Mycena galopus ATCC 62051]
MGSFAAVEPLSVAAAAAGMGAAAAARGALAILRLHAKLRALAAVRRHGVAAAVGPPGVPSLSSRRAAPHPCSPPSAATRSLLYLEWVLLLLAAVLSPSDCGQQRLRALATVRHVLATAVAGVGAAAASCSALGVVTLHAAAPALAADRRHTVVAATAGVGAAATSCTALAVVGLCAEAPALAVAAAAACGSIAVIVLCEGATQLVVHGVKGRRQSRSPVEHRARETKPRAEIQQEINRCEERGDVWYRETAVTIQWGASPAESILDTEPRGAKTNKESAPWQAKERRRSRGRVADCIERKRQNVPSRTCMQDKAQKSRDTARVRRCNLAPRERRRGETRD